MNLHNYFDYFYCSPPSTVAPTSRLPQETRTLAKLSNLPKAQRLWPLSSTTALLCLSTPDRPWVPTLRRGRSRRSLRSTHSCWEPWPEEPRIVPSGNEISACNADCTSFATASGFRSRRLASYWRILFRVTEVTDSPWAL